MKHLLAIILAFFLFSGAKAQVPDSLVRMLQSQKGVDLANTQLKVAAMLTLRSSDSSLMLADFAEKAFAEAKQANGLVDAYLQKVEVYNHLRNKEQALAYSRRALETAQSAQLKARLGDVYSKYGNAYYMANDIDPSTEMYYRALESYEAAKDTAGLIVTTGHLAMIYQKNGQFDKAKELYFASLAGQEALKQQGQMVRTLFNIALLYNMLNKNDSCLLFAEKTVALGKALNSGFAQAKGYQIGGNALIKLQQYDRAFEFLNAAYGLTQRTPFHNETQRTYLDIGYTHYYTGNYAKAIQIGKEIMAEPQVFDQDNTYRLLYMATKANKSFGESLQYLELWKELRDSTSRVMQAQRFTELQTKYETEKKEAEIERLANEAEIQLLESQRNRNYFIGASMIGALILGISIIANNQLRLRRKADLAEAALKSSKEKMKLETQFREAELKALKSQMNPHFIFNALNSIQEYIMLNDKENAANYLGKFADLIRNYLYHSNMGSITLADELEALTLYLELEQVRFEEQFSFGIQTRLQSGKESIEIPTMLIQPYVENAIKHGLLHRAGEKRLDLLFIEHEKTIECHITDNGVGREKSAEINAKRRKGHQSFASEATESRLELLNHQSEDKIGVEIMDLKEGAEAIGTKVIISIPKQA